MTVYVLGTGPGNPRLLTVAAQEALACSSLIIGSNRLIEPYRHDEKKCCVALINPQRILEEIMASKAEHIAVLMSGDIGFYSGADKLRTLLMQENIEVEYIPGISSLVYFCTKLHQSWDKVKLVSAHGRKHNLVGEIQIHHQVFALLGSDFTVHDLAQGLLAVGLGDVSVFVGENLSYNNEVIVSTTARELLLREFSSLSVVLICNPYPVKRGFAAPSLRDADFIRDSVPMTKEEVRMVSIAKLRIESHSIVWDIGAGTGSISIEAALAATKGRVYAIERNEQALSLLRQNTEQFRLSNIEIIGGIAPGALHALPAPDCVFLGGSSGRLKEILEVVLEKNPHARFVINAITLETLSTALELLQKFDLQDVDMVQLSVTRTKQAGPYHLMDAQNPVWIISAQVGSALVNGQDREAV